MALTRWSTLFIAFTAMSLVVLLMFVIVTRHYNAAQPFVTRVVFNDVSADTATTFNDTEVTTPIPMTNMTTTTSLAPSTVIIAATSVLHDERGFVCKAWARFALEVPSSVVHIFSTPQLCGTLEQAPIQNLHCYAPAQINDAYAYYFDFLVSEGRRYHNTNTRPAYAFVNGDIVFENPRNMAIVVDATSALAQHNPFLLIGRRINLIFESSTSRAYTAELMSDDAQDWFVFNDAFYNNISPLPPSRLGGVIFDNWLSSYGSSGRGVISVDCSLSILALHVYTSKTIVGQGFSHKTNASQHNRIIHSMATPNRTHPFNNYFSGCTCEMSWYTCAESPGVLHKTKARLERCNRSSPTLQWPLCALGDPMRLFMMKKREWEKKMFLL